MPTSALDQLAGQGHPTVPESFGSVAHPESESARGALAGKPGPSPPHLAMGSRAVTQIRSFQSILWETVVRSDRPGLRLACITSGSSARRLRRVGGWAC
jgi:hypothetical protein